MKRIKLLKRFQTSRVLLSLTLCSVALVVFSAVVYTTALAGVLADEQESVPLSILNRSTEAIEPNQDPTAPSPYGAGDDIIGASGLSLASPSLLDISSQGGGSSANGSADSKDGDGSKMNGSGKTSAGQSGESSSTNLASGSASAADSGSEGASAVDAAAEDAYHRHIAKYYAELSEYYKHLCSGLENAYSTINSNAKGTVSIAPVNAETYIFFLDGKRQAAMECKYNGVHIDGKSKWYGEYENVWRMYENLVNLTSIMREINGLGSDTARKRIEYYSNSSGKIREIADFEQRYSKARL